MAGAAAVAVEFQGRPRMLAASSLLGHTLPALSILFLVWLSADFGSSCEWAKAATESTKAKRVIAARAVRGSLCE